MTPPFDSEKTEGRAMRYDPAVGPEARAWLEMDEQRRMAAVREYHQRSGARMPSDRHEAVHAVGSVLSRHLFRTMQGETPFDTAAYDSRLDELTADGWKSGAAGRD
jgi:hypothetical protein